MVTVPDGSLPVESTGRAGCAFHAAGDLAALAVKLASKLSRESCPVEVLGPALPSCIVKLVVVPAAMLALCTLLAMLAPTWW